jgi:alginate O-acetyltransferase complex protein AlgI
MVFSSLIFLFRFLPIALLLLFFTPKKYQNLLLFILSLIFYAWGEVRYIFIMFLSVILDFFSSQGIKRYRNHPWLPKVMLMISVIGNLGMLFFFKYLGFIGSLFALDLPTLTLPLGISFYTFQTMSYTIDVYRGKVEAEDNIIDFGAFVCLFPQLIAGPIVKYSQIAYELKHRVMSMEKFESGLKLFLLGLASKVLLANNIGMMWDDIIRLPVESLSTMTAWLGTLAFGFQIYFDFSGYSLMAIGLGSMLGFNFPQNFNYPYISKSMTEFWNRWHMTLGSWFKEYVYIPLGGNRKGTTRQILNLFIVWFLTGFWHGAAINFILWGLYFFVLLVIEKLVLIKWLNQRPILSRVYFIFFILIGWAIFAITDLSLLGQYLTAMFTLQPSSQWMYFISNYGVVLLFCLIFSTDIPKKVMSSVSFPMVEASMVTVLFLFCIAYLVDSSYNPFLYFRF